MNRRSWNTIESHRNFLEKLKVKFQIREPSDWGKVTIQDINAHGGASLLKYYQSSLFKCLQSIFTGWKIL